MSAVTSELPAAEGQPKPTQAIYELAVEHFGSADKADRWLARPTSALGGAAPNELLGSEEGIDKVEALLGAIAHGLAA